MEGEKVAVDDDGDDNDEAEAAAPVDGPAAGQLEVERVDQVAVVAGHQQHRQQGAGPARRPTS